VEGRLIQVSEIGLHANTTVVDLKDLVRLARVDLEILLPVTEKVPAFPQCLYNMF